MHERAIDLNIYLWSTISIIDKPKFTPAIKTFPNCSSIIKNIYIQNIHVFTFMIFLLFMGQARKFRK